MKKFLTYLLIIIILGFGGYYIYINYFGIPKVEVEEEKVKIDEYFIYGNHFNIKGTLDIDNVNFKNIKLVLYNGEDKEFDINYEKNGTEIIFNTSNVINEGMYIDNLEKGTYYLFLRISYEDKKKEEVINKYYVLDNNTNYNSITYYTLSKYNNKIIIKTDEDYGTFMFDVKENNDKEIYDVTIDPGHGGLDSGALSGSYKESDFTMDISLKVKKLLENKGITVKLTHKENEIDKDKTMDEYNEHGRAVIPNEVKSKYTFSIHFNKNAAKSVHGVEIYTPNNIDISFAKTISDAIIQTTDLDYSSNRLYKADNGVYTHNFTESEVKSSLDGYKEKGYKPYNVSTKSNYLYMIRETGGYLTGAYVDDSNIEKVGINPYYNSNMGNESYLLELGYMSNTNDLAIILSSKDKIAKAISDSIIKELEIEK